MRCGPLAKPPPQGVQLRGWKFWVAAKKSCWLGGPLGWSDYLQLARRPDADKKTRKFKATQKQAPHPDCTKFQLGVGGEPTTTLSPPIWWNPVDPPARGVSLRVVGGTHQKQQQRRMEGQPEAPRRGVCCPAGGRGCTGERYLTGDGMLPKGQGQGQGDTHVASEVPRRHMATKTPDLRLWRTER